jgi:hypothetical protein
MTITRMTFSTGRICSREATSKRVGTDPTFSRRIFSLTNQIAEIWFSITFSKHTKSLKPLNLQLQRHNLQVKFL